MLQRRIWLAFLLVLAVGIAVSARIVTLGDSVQAVNRMFIAEKLPCPIASENCVAPSQTPNACSTNTIPTPTSKCHSRHSAQQNDRHMADDRRRTGKGLGVEGTGRRTAHARLVELGRLSDSLAATLASGQIDWDKARALLAQIKPKVRADRTSRSPPSARPTSKQ